MSREEYPLVWWVKKHLPHRHGQRCERIDTRPEDICERLRPEPWQAADPEWRCFEFEDGTREWGPKHCARRPARDWQDELGHRTPECTGEWRIVRGGIACTRCDVWVRRTEDNEKEVDASHRTERAIHRAVKANRWRAVIEAARDGTEPLAFIRALVQASRRLSYDDAFIDAAGEFRVLVGHRARQQESES